MRYSLLPLLLLVAACQQSSTPRANSGPQDTANSFSSKGEGTTHPENNSAGRTSTASESKRPPTSEENREPFGSKARGAIQVKGETGDWFEILQNGKRVVPQEKRLNGTVEIAPGEYQVRVNKTERTVQVEIGKKVVLHTGTLLVQGKKANFYAPFQGKERKVSGNPPALGAPIALFAGTYRVELNLGANREVVLTDNAEIVAGKKTVLNE